MTKNKKEIIVDPSPAGPVEENTMPHVRMELTLDEQGWQEYLALFHRPEAVYDTVRLLVIPEGREMSYCAMAWAALRPGGELHLAAKAAGLFPGKAQEACEEQDCVVIRKAA